MGIITKETVEDPNENDILFGRDSDSWNHEGNRRFRSFVAKYQSKYHTTNSRAEKVRIVANIVKELKSAGTKFLKRDHPKKKWYEVDRKACIEKVGHAIRDKMAIAQRRQTKKAQAAQRDSSPRASIVLSSVRAEQGTRALAGLEDLCDSDLALRNPALFDTMMARRLMAGDIPSSDLINALKARNVQSQAFDMASHKLAAVDSLLSALKEQEQAKKEIVAYQQRRNVLAAMISTKSVSDNGLLSASNLAGLPYLQTARRHSGALLGSNSSLLRHPSSSILDSMLQFRRASAPPCGLTIPAALAAQFT